MQLARCPECGAAIGGQNHRNVEGVRQAVDIEQLATDVGRMGVASAIVGDAREKERRLDQPAVGQPHEPRATARKRPVPRPLDAAVDDTQPGPVTGPGFRGVCDENENPTAPWPRYLDAFRASTSVSTQPTSKAFDILRGLIDSLARDAAPSGLGGYPDVNKLLKSLRQICQHVAASTSSALQDDFRHAHGFDETEMLSLFALLGDCLGRLVGLRLRAIPANRRFFRYRVEGGGWDALEQVIASIGLGGAELDPWASCHLLASCLLSRSKKKAWTSFASLLPRHYGQIPPLARASLTRTMSSTRDYEQWHLVLARSIESIAPAVREIVDSKSIIRFPEILRAVVSFWKAIPRPQNSSASPSSVLVLETILCATSTSFYNRAAVHSTGVLSQFLQVAFGQGSWLAQPEREKLLAICKLLMFLGFDLSLNGHSSLELPSLGRTFPPQSTGGYTFTAWIRVESFDPKAHTTIFGVFDASQSCFVLIYLEKDTHNLILQTSVFSNKPSVRFKTAVFREKEWYHVAVVHKRPKNHDHKQGIAQALWPDRPWRRLSSQWSLASAHLFEDVLTDDYLAVHYGLGPRYQGNFQDSLGGFQTYEASAILGLRNEIVHPGKDGNSEILRAVREKASSLLPESKILLSVLPTATFPDNVQYMDNGVLRSLPSRLDTQSLSHGQPRGIAAGGQLRSFRACRTLSSDPMGSHRSAEPPSS
ncbi:hypothetical protein G6O67_008908 [Ophiocordyceps sinensis]|uniref:RZ-type domain-containing protein n=1 Tax=Ophiocordyceps sinensis TaxID=72228 RepID=A0A8H4LQI1_9HYPO|nr:hypothetical protein G6O67_008908 [Ophiocordyceps sinensis]